MTILDDINEVLTQDYCVYDFAIEFIDDLEDRIDEICSMRNKTNDEKEKLEYCKKCFNLASSVAESKGSTKTERLGCKYCNSESSECCIFKECEEYCYMHETTFWDEFRDEFSTESIPIKFCPWCGRELGDANDNT